jgi:ubiquinone/menaquinone biosynthesis C-methylase UbiE
MPTFEEIYAAHAEAYDALVQREDYEGHLLPALAGIARLRGARVVELGAGTGRLTRLIAPLAQEIRAYDASAHMLGVARLRLVSTGLTNWELGVADNKRLPVEDRAADVAIAGWCLGHAVDWFPESWRDEIGAALDEMARVLRPGGTAITLETMTTGSQTAAPPTEGLAEYYRWLETERGFTGISIRTDYRFESLDEAERLTCFFFGAELADRVRHARWTILPESTGVWWRTY